MTELFRKPLAWVPVLMSFLALALLLICVAVFGFQHEAQADEGTAAHLFQLLMGIQPPLMLFFLLKWLPQSPKQATLIFVAQLASMIPPFTLLYFFEH